MFESICGSLLINSRQIIVVKVVSQKGQNWKANTGIRNRDTKPKLEVYYGTDKDHTHSNLVSTYHTVWYLTHGNVFRVEQREHTT